MSIKFTIKGGEVQSVQTKQVSQYVMNRQDREKWEEEKEELAGYLMEIAARTEMEHEIDKLNMRMERSIENLKKRLEKKYEEYGIKFI